MIRRRGPRVQPLRWPLDPVTIVGDSSCRPRSFSARPPVEIDEPRGPVRVGSEIRQPQRLRYVRPAYPPAARAAHIQGDVRIDAIIDANGRVVELKLVAGHPLLVRAAMHAVQQWIYEPTYVNGRPVPVVFGITVEFRVR